MSASKKRRAKTTSSTPGRELQPMKRFLGCKHVPNAQVSIRAECCGRWYDCPLCHDEKEGHTFMLKNEVVFACKVCNQAFRKNMQQFEEHDECCPHCGNCFVVAHSKEAEETTDTQKTNADATAASVSAATLCTQRSRQSARSTGRSSSGTARSSKSQRK